MNDLRQLAAAADQYFLENSVVEVVAADLVPTYIKTVTTGNTYPETLYATSTEITATTAWSTVTYVVAGE